jgi:CheY-like chemotaxis protein
MAVAGTSPVVLLAVPQEHPLPRQLEARQYSVVQVHTGTLALRWARDLRPDAIIVAAELPDMPGIELCEQLHSDVRIGHNVPILVLVPGKPTPAQRVDALRAGAWDFLPDPSSAERLALKLQTYVQAKRNIDVALAGGLYDPATGLHSRASLARRARELGVLMARTRGSLACVVFTLDVPATDPRVGSLVARTARGCDVVGVLSPADFAVLAPATDHSGALALGKRFADAFCGATERGGPLPAGATLRVGYDAVINLRYWPIDPVELLSRAAQAARTGQPDPVHPWARRFDERTGARRDDPEAVRNTPPGLVLEVKGRTGP